MRTISAAQTQVLATPHRSSHIKVEVYDGASWINLSNHCGKDWLASVTYGESQDGRVADATFVVQLADHELNMSPLMTASHCNDPNVVLDIGNEVRINAAVMSLEQTPAAADWMLVFRGQIDTWEIGDSTITCRCADFGQQLADAYIETESEDSEYADGSTDVSGVIQNILDDWKNTPDEDNVTLWSVNGTAGTEFAAGDKPGWNINVYRQKREPVLDAIKRLANMIGYDLRYRWQTDSEDFELMMWEPDRDASGGVDYTFGTDEILAVKGVSLSRRAIRNVITVVYTDDEGIRQSYTSTGGGASETKYGRRWCEIQEDASSQIDTSSEAQDLADAIEGDLKEPTAKVTMTVPFFPWAQLQDYYTVTANNYQFSANQSLSVIGVRHNLTNKGAVTTLTLEGKPRGGVAAHLSVQQRQIRRTLDNTNVSTASVEHNLCPNGDLTGYDGQ